MRKQRGLGLVGFISVAMVFVLLAVLSFKILPVLIEYTTIERMFKSIATDPALRGAPRVQLERAWGMRASVDNVKSIDSSQIDFSKEGDQVVVTGEYSVKVPLFGNTSACFDFKPSSK